MIIIHKLKKYFYIYIIFLILIISVSIKYGNYLDLIDEEVFEVNTQVLNIYNKNDKLVLKLKADDFICYTSVSNNTLIEKLDNINILIISKNISFIEYLKGFYTKTLFINSIDRSLTLKKKIYLYLHNVHLNKQIANLFSLLFVAIPIDNSLRNVFTNYGISHLVAISGFHLSLMMIIVYSIFFYPYKIIQERFFPYRNRKFDLILISIFFVSLYLIFIDFIPSFLRAFIMFFIGIYLLRNDIKLLSYKNLIITFFIVISLFPTYLFSIGFWFSIIAVFYIFLYIQYFKNINKYFHFIFFNIWIFLVFNPIVHYFFFQTTYEQLFSPLLTMLFTLFYPLEIVVHIMNFSEYFDSYLIAFIEYEFFVFSKVTPLWFLIIFSLVSLYSIFNKYFFIFLNILMILFNIYLFFLSLE